MKRCFERVRQRSRWKERVPLIFFLFFSFIFLLRGTRHAPRRLIRKNTDRCASLFARLWGREGNWWGNRVAGEGRGFVDRSAARNFSRGLFSNYVRARVRRTVVDVSLLRSCARACVSGEGKGIRDGIG